MMVHDWHIEEREYARQESRRGRRHAFTALSPRRTALVVVDMVPFFVLENPYCRGIVPNIRRLAAALRGAAARSRGSCPEPAGPRRWQTSSSGRRWRPTAEILDLMGSGDGS